MPPTTRKKHKSNNAIKSRWQRAAKSQALRNIEFQTLPSEICEHVVEDTTQDSGSSTSQSESLCAHRPPENSTRTRGIVPTDPEEKKEYLQKQRQERIANETPLQKDIRREKNRINERQRMERKRREETEEEKEDRLAKQREAVNKTRQRLPHEFKMAWEDPDVSRLLLHRLTEPIISDTNLRIFDSDTQDKIKKLFTPITLEETKSHIDHLRDAIDRHSVMYGCASCGIRVTPFGHSKVNRIPLKLLRPLFQYDQPNSENNQPAENEEDVENEQDRIFHQKPGSTVLEMKVDTRAEAGCFTYIKLALCPQFMERIQKSYSPESKALLCDNFYRCVIQKRLPPLCFKTWDLGDVKSLPKLSLLETLLIQRIRPFTHLAKLVDGKGKFALSGHCMAIPTDAAELVAQRISMDQKDNLIFPRRVTTDNCGLSVVFLGTIFHFHFHLYLVRFPPGETHTFEG